MLDVRRTAQFERIARTADGHTGRGIDDDGRDVGCVRLISSAANVCRGRQRAVRANLREEIINAARLDRLIRCSNRQSRRGVRSRDMDAACGIGGDRSWNHIRAAEKRRVYETRAGRIDRCGESRVAIVGAVPRTSRHEGIDERKIAATGMQKCGI